MQAISNIEEEMTKVPLNASTKAISRKLNKIMEQNLSEGEVYELRKLPLSTRVKDFKSILIQQATDATKAAAAIAGVTMTDATPTDTETSNKFEWATLDEHATMFSNQESKNIATYLIIALMITIATAAIVTRINRTTTADKGRNGRRALTITTITTALATILSLVPPSAWTPHIATATFLAISAGHMVATLTQATSTSKTKAPEAHEEETTGPKPSILDTSPDNTKHGNCQTPYIKRSTIPRYTPHHDDK
jgi:hypothetical protein